MKNYVFLLILTLFSSEGIGQDNMYINYDRAPQLLGGYDSLFKAIKVETILPTGCTAEGKVFVMYTISETGDVSDIEISKGLCSEADTIAVNIVARFKYRPAEYNQKVMSIIQTLAIPFFKKS